MDTKLTFGKIPKNTVCPFIAECPHPDICNHQGEHHDADYSCATARYLDLKNKRQKEQPK